MVEVDPAFDSRSAAKVLRSIEEWMVQQAHAAKPTIQTAGIDNCGPEKGTESPPIVAAPEPSFELSSSASPERPIDQTQQANRSPARSNALFVSKWMVRSVVGGLVIAIIVGVVWQTYRDNQARKLIKTWGHSSVIWLSSSFGATQHDSKLLAQSSTKSSDQAAQTPAAASMQANEVAEFKQHLLAVVNDLAVMRRDVEQLSSKHEQLSRDVATVQATLQNVSERISPLAQPAPTHGPPGKSVPRLVRAEAPRQPAAAPVPPETPRQPAAAPVPPETPRQQDAASAPPTTSPAGLTEQPPRPPLPVPTAAQTPPPPR
jgi:hypothetical protein